MWFPRLLLILVFPSVPGRIPRMIAVLGLWPRASINLRLAVTMLKSWSLPPICTSTPR